VPPLNHIAQTGTTRGDTLEPIPASIVGAIWIAVTVAVPSGIGQQNVAGQSDGIAPHRVSQESSPSRWILAETVSDVGSTCFACAQAQPSWTSAPQRWIAAA
jgi:hypothetical protein